MIAQFKFFLFCTCPIDTYLLMLCGINYLLNLAFTLALLAPLLNYNYYSQFQALNSSTQYWMSSVKNLNHVTAYKASNLPTHWEVVLDRVWEHSSFQRSAKNTQTESWTPSLLSHRQRYLIPLSNHTTPPSPSINSLKTPTRPTASITKPSTTSASGKSFTSGTLPEWYQNGTNFIF